MAAPRHTPEQRRNAVALYTEVGPAEAARRTGISLKTIASWARREGVQTDAPDRTRAAVEQAKLTFEQRRQQLASALLDDAERLRRQLFASASVHHFDKDGGFHQGDLAEPTFGDKRNIVTALGGLVEHAQLLAGQATSRVEHTSKLETEIDDLVAELAANDPDPVEVGV